MTKAEAKRCQKLGLPWYSIDDKYYNQAEYLEELTKVIFDQAKTLNRYIKMTNELTKDVESLKSAFILHKCVNIPNVVITQEFKPATTEDRKIDLNL